MKKSITIGALTLTLLATSAPAYAATLPTAVRTQLVYLVEEEKLARDVYTVLAKSSGNQKFANIAKSEQTHMNNISALLKTYKIADPTIGAKAGVFKNASLAKLYKTLIAQGKKSAADAIKVGILIEETDIADLDKLAQIASQTDIKSAVALLRSGSENHLAAFKR
jgi:hypothetical protein